MLKTTMMIYIDHFGARAGCGSVREKYCAKDGKQGVDTTQAKPNVVDSTLEEGHLDPGNVTIRLHPVCSRFWVLLLSAATMIIVVVLLRVVPRTITW